MGVRASRVIPPDPGYDPAFAGEVGSGFRESNQADSSADPTDPTYFAEKSQERATGGRRVARRSKSADQGGSVGSAPQPPAGAGESREGEGGSSRDRSWDQSKRFVVVGPPVPKERPRVFRGHAITPKRTLSYERLVGLCARAAGVRVLEGHVRVRAVFYCADERRRDIDNLVKSILDGLNGVAWADDSQVKHLDAQVLVDRKRPRVEVELEAIAR